MLVALGMDLLENDQLKLRILEMLKDGPELTINGLRDALGDVNYTSVKRACLFLERVGLVRLESKAMGGRQYTWVSRSQGRV